MKIADFFATIGLQVEDKDLKQFDDKMSEVRTNVAKFTAVIGAALFALDRFSASSVRGAVALRNFSLQTGLSAKSLQQWQAAAQLSNMAIDADQVTSSIQGLQDSLTQIRLGAGNTTPFQLLGIDVRGRDAFNVLDQLREKIKGVEPAMATNLVQQMGLTPEFINVLQLSREEFNALGKDLVRSQSTTKALREIGDAVNRFKLQFLKFKDDFVAKLKPLFLGIIDVLNRLGKALSSIVFLMERFPAVSAGAAAAIALILTPLKVLRFILSPITLLLGALFLLLEDFAVYMQGGKSVIGKLVDFFKGLYDDLKTSFFDPMMDYWATMAEFIKVNIIEPIKGIGETVKEALPDINIGTDDQGRGLMERVGDNTLSAFEKMNPASMFRKLFSNMPNANGASGFSVPESLSQTISRMNAPVFHNSFVISGGDGGQIANNIVDGLQNQLNYGLSDTNNGAAY